MALGSANTSAQSRSKNKPVKLKRYKEVKLAKGYTKMSASPAQVIAACGYSLPLKQTLYHNGSSANPVIGDIVYSRQRANSKYGLKNGYYKVQPVGGLRTYSIQITGNDGIVAAVTAC